MGDDGNMELRAWMLHQGGCKGKMLRFLAAKDGGCLCHLIFYLDNNIRWMRETSF
jgi:hypothetical protein